MMAFKAHFFNSILPIVFCVVIFCNNALGSKSIKAKVTDATYSLSLGNYSGINSEVISMEINIGANTEVEVLISDIPLEMSFLVVQAHSYLYNVSLMNSGQIKSLLGTNLGFVHTVTALHLPVFYISNDNVVNVTVMLAVIGYSANAPIPGGCNMEFETKIAPYLHLSSSSALVKVESQPALFKKCSVSHFITYDFYHMYQLESDFTMASYFKAISSMISPADIKKNGRLVKASPLSTPMRHLFSAYHGTGSVYALIASVYGTNISSAYIPAHTYACSMISFTNPCVNSPLGWTIGSVFLAIFGALLCVYGHGFFRTSLFIQAFLVSSVLMFSISGLISTSPTFGEEFNSMSYWQKSILQTLYFATGLVTGCGYLMSLRFLAFLLISLTSLFLIGSSVNPSVVLFVGLACGLVWIRVWNKFAHPFTSTLLSALILSFFVFSAILYTPYGDNVLLQSNINFAVLFVCLCFLILCLYSLAPHQLNALSCSVLGSYLIVLALDYFLGTNMKYVALNPLRRLGVEGFNAATLDPPVQNVDLLLSGLWAVLVGVGVISQRLYMEGKPSFPPPYEEEEHSHALLDGSTQPQYQAIST